MVGSLTGINRCPHHIQVTELDTQKDATKLCITALSSKNALTNHSFPKQSLITYQNSDMKLTAVVALLGALAYNAQALRPAPPVSDYISEDSKLGHCNNPTVKNVGTFSVDRVRCGCNDDEEKVGRSLGYTHYGPWKVSVHTATCVPEGTADDRYMCTRIMPQQCEKPGIFPEKCDRCHCSCSYVSAEPKRFPRKTSRHLRKVFSPAEQECPAGEKFDRCATSRCNNERKCGDEVSYRVLKILCLRARVLCGEAGCVCKDGLVRDQSSGLCVERDYCTVMPDRPKVYRL